MLYVSYVRHSAKKVILKLKRDHQKISYERRPYESVGWEAVLFIFIKPMKIRIQAFEG